MAERALAEGATRRSLMRVYWQVSGDCSSPVSVLFYARPEAERGRELGWSPGMRHSLEVECETRCRKCSNCLAAKSYHWTMRAQFEMARSYRTWFGTLTLRPEEQFLALSRARRRVVRNGDDFDQLTTADQFADVVAQITPEVTRYLKRIRKVSGAVLRYLLVAESHQSGCPHFHILLHENDAVGVRHAMLTAQWGLGFSQFKLAEGPVAARYLCKYISKSAMARVRASIRYGKDDLDHSPQRGSNLRGREPRPPKTNLFMGTDQ